MKEMAKERFLKMWGVGDGGRGVEGDGCDRYWRCRRRGIRDGGR